MRCTLRQERRFLSVSHQLVSTKTTMSVAMQDNVSGDDTSNAYGYISGIHTCMGGGCHEVHLATRTSIPINS